MEAWRGGRVLKRCEFKATGRGGSTCLAAFGGGGYVPGGTRALERAEAAHIAPVGKIEIAGVIMILLRYTAELDSPHTYRVCATVLLYDLSIC